MTGTEEEGKMTDNSMRRSNDRQQNEKGQMTDNRMKKSNDRQQNVMVKGQATE